MAQMYSLKEFDSSLRTEMQLPANPYHSEEAVEYLKNLGVFFYRDQDHAEGIIIQPDEMSEDINKTGNFMSYYFEVGFLGDGTPEPWDKASQEIISKNGDDRAWLAFNKQRVVHTFTETAIKYS